MKPSFEHSGKLIALSGLLVASAVLWFATTAAEDFDARDAARVEADKPLTCARARWRLADRDQLRNSLLSLSHILIRHSGSVPRAVPLSQLDWELDTVQPARTRAAALERARSLEFQLHATPQAWSDLVRKHSEDPATREAEGRLGVFAASEFLLWPIVLDCLAPLREGAFTIAETAAGIHVFRRDSAPPFEQFSAKRIVIGYEGAGFLKYVARRAVPQRSRAEALAIARSILERARSEGFDSLVQAYSEHRDAEQGGDIGAWSTHEATNFPRLMEAITAVRVGEMTQPLDSEIGFQIFLRTAPEKRPRFAMQGARFGFEPGSSQEARKSQDQAMRHARTYLEAWRVGVSRPTDARYRGNEGPVESWTSGRGPQGVEWALAQLKIGELLGEPLATDSSYLVAQRLAPPELDSRRAQLWLPEPAEPDLVQFVVSSPRSTLERIWQSLEGDLDSNIRSSCQDLHRTFMAAVQSSVTAQERRLAWAAFSDGLNHRLSADAASGYQHRLLKRVRDHLLGHMKQ